MRDKSIVSLEISLLLARNWGNIREGANPIDPEINA
jgi:hypothetical protein